jgi:hypothetical protein
MTDVNGKINGADLKKLMVQLISSSNKNQNRNYVEYYVSEEFKKLQPDKEGKITADNFK